MSYTLFLLLNVNHEKTALLDHIGTRLEQTSPTSFCFDHSPDSFFSADYLQEGSDTSLVIDIPFGAEETVLKDVLDFMTFLQEAIQYQVLDPQLGKKLSPNQAQEIFQKWRDLNYQALASYADGHYFLRNVEQSEQGKRMIEAIRFQEETWQNHCSLALSYSRIQDAEGAQRHFERALELDPANPGIIHALGVTHFNLKDYARAKSLFEEALQLDPENDSARELIEDCVSKLQ